MDVLTDICANLRLNAELYFRASLCAPFCIAVPKDKRLIRFHCVLEGSCYVGLPSGHCSQLNAGDLVLVPEGASQLLSSSPDLSHPIALESVLEAYPVVGGELCVADSEVDTRLLCGYLQFEQANKHPVLSVLPEVLVLQQDDPHYGLALRLLYEEANQAGHGASFVLHRVVEIILIQFLRTAVTQQSGKNTFIAALRDPKLALCLQAMHAQPHYPWSLEKLAQHAGSSRSVISERFNATMGMSPMVYLTQWRMSKARQLLEQSQLSMAEIAERCGYTSVPAFSRRFLACYGKSPGRWRKQAIESRAQV